LFICWLKVSIHDSISCIISLLLRLALTYCSPIDSKKGSKKVDSFDARKIFGQYGSEDWGEYLIPEAHLSQRFVFDDDGYYHCCASIPFPEEMQLD